MQMPNVKRETSNVKCKTSRYRLLSLVILTFLLLISNPQAHASGLTHHASNLQYPIPNTQYPTWVEPRSLNITNLAGQIPDSLLQGVIISAYPWDGIIQFESSSVSGDTMVITTTIYGRLHPWGTTLGCLGQVPRADEMGSAAPLSYLKIYTPGGPDVTSQITKGSYLPATLTQPLSGTAPWQRRHAPPPLHRR